MQPEWVPLTTAAKLAGGTPYKIKTAVVAGHVRARVLAGFPVVYNRSDALQLRQSLMAS
jgi:hypothetical protein